MEIEIGSGSLRSQRALREQPHVVGRDDVDAGEVLFLDDEAVDAGIDAELRIARDHDAGGDHRAAVVDRRHRDRQLEEVDVVAEQRHLARRRGFDVVRRDRLGDRLRQLVFDLAESLAAERHDGALARADDAGDDRHVVADDVVEKERRLRTGRPAWRCGGCRPAGAGRPVRRFCRRRSRNWRKFSCIARSPDERQLTALAPSYAMSSGRRVAREPGPMYHSARCDPHRDTWVPDRASAGDDTKWDRHERQNHARPPAAQARRARRSRSRRGPSGPARRSKATWSSACARRRSTTTTCSRCAACRASRCRCRSSSGSTWRARSPRSGRASPAGRPATACWSIRSTRRRA